MSNDELISRLSRFTPSAGLDREALLFEAGRASARPSGRWMALAGALAASQLVLLVLLLWPRPAPPSNGPAPLPPPIVSVEPPQPPSPSQLWNLREQALESDGNLLSSPPVEPGPPEAPLRVFDVNSILN